MLYRPRSVRSMPCACLHVSQPCVSVGALLTLKKGLVELSYLWRDVDWVPEPASGWLGLSQAPL